jgi:hypothetical protein
MRQKSRNWTAKVGSALVLALVACSVTYAQDVRTNYMPGTDFSKYHTYAWVTDVQGVPRVGGQPDQILDTPGQAGDRFANGGQGPHQGGGRQ